jgi:hypothetical protein
MSDHVKPSKVICHLIQVDDDMAQRAAICSQGDFKFTSDNRNEKMAAAYQHLADVLWQSK